MKIPLKAEGAFPFLDCSCIVWHSYNKTLAYTIGRRNWAIARHDRLFRARHLVRKGLKQSMQNVKFETTGCPLGPEQNAITACKRCGPTVTGRDKDNEEVGARGHSAEEGAAPFLPNEKDPR